MIPSPRVPFSLELVSNFVEFNRIIVNSNNCVSSSVVRGFLITDRLVNYLDKAEDSTKACREINSKVVKGVPQANAETAPAMIINKIREKFYRKQ